MNRSRSVLRSAVMLFSLVLVLAGVTAPAVANDLEDILGRGEFVFALSGQYPPFSFVNERNEVVGFDVAIGMEIADRLGVEGEAITTPFDGLIAGLLAGRFDAIIASMAITEERAGAVDFTRTYYRSGGQLFVPEASAIQCPEGLEPGMRVGVSLGTTYEQYLRDHHPGVQVRTYRGDPDVFRDLNIGRLDAMVTDRIVGLLAIQEQELPFRLAGDLLYEERIGIAVRKGSDQLTAKINAILGDMYEDGTYERIALEWVGADIR